MLSNKLQDALNEQINKEFFSEYLYLSMSAYLQAQDLDGFANYFSVQAQEEHFHAMKLFNFVNDVGGRVKLKAIDSPQTDFNSIIEVFELSLEHEKHITKSIDDLMDVAISENDHAVRSFLQWYVDEQVEEEATASRLITKLKMINGEGHGLLMLDNELGQRKFTVEG
jgi:ferritin